MRDTILCQFDAQCNYLKEVNRITRTNMEKEREKERKIDIEIIQRMLFLRVVLSPILSPNLISREIKTSLSNKSVFFIYIYPLQLKIRDFEMKEQHVLLFEGKN